MPIHCSWCNNELTPDEAARRADRRVGHALCANCSEFLVFQMGVPLQTFLDRLPAPIFVVDNDVVVQAANSAAYRTLGKTPDQVLRKIGGMVFECTYARLPEGCGGTVHCSGCAIRRSVFHTYETGESLRDVPATLMRDESGASQEITMLVSTEKMGDAVLLKLENVRQAVGK